MCDVQADLSPVVGFQRAEDAAGCHGSSAGDDAGPSGLQIPLPPDPHHHQREELRQNRVYQHHHVCRPVLPAGERTRRLLYGTLLK